MHRRDDRARRDRLREDQRPERDGDDRVDVGVRPDHRDRHVGEQPGVGGEGEDRAERRSGRRARPHDRVEKSATSVRPISPSRLPPTTSAAPPASISIPVPAAPDRGRVVAGVQRAMRPRDRADPAPGRRPWIEARRCPRPARAGWRPRDAGDEAADDEAARPLPRESGIEQRQPDRHGGDEDRGDPGGNEQLAEHYAAVAAEQEQRADDGGRTPIAQRVVARGRRARRIAANGDDPAQHDQPGACRSGCLPKATAASSRSSPRCEVGRSPQDIHGEQGDDDGDRRRRSPSGRSPRIVAGR